MQGSLKEPEKSESILPLIISITGAEDEPVEEIIFCDSISGGAKYNDNMPMELSLIRRLADGSEYRMRYIQSKPDIFEQTYEKVKDESIS